jgi:hypothetical protein
MVAKPRDDGVGVIIAALVRVQPFVQIMDIKPAVAVGGRSPVARDIRFQNV